MAEQVSFQTQFKITGPDGTVVYVGASRICNPIDVLSAEASATISVDEAAIISAATTTIAPSFAASALTDNIAVVKVVDASSVLPIGVSQTVIPFGQRGVLAGAGSMVPVRTATGVVANYIITAAAGAMATSATVVVGKTLGLTFKAVATVNSITVAGVLIAPQ